MIRNGVLLLKKHNHKKVQSFKLCTFLIPLFLLVSLMASCKSTPELLAVQPLDLIDSKSSFYLRIPTSVDSLLLENVLASRYPEMSKDNIKKVASRIDTVYLGLNRSKKGISYQIALDCDFPKFATNSAFSKKNGWDSKKITFSPSVSYTLHSRQGIEAAFPSERVACFGRDVEEMLNRYNSISLCSEVVTVEPNFRNTYDWLSYEGGIPDNEIHFFASRPQSFLTMLIGAQLNYQLEYIRGKMYNDLYKENQYIMQLEFEFKDRRILPAAKGALTLALGLTDSEVKKDSETHLTISNIKINKTQLYKLLSLK